MSLSDVMLQNFMPRNILDSDDDGDSWSLGGRSSGGSSLSGDSHSSTTGSPSYKSKMDAHQDFRLFGDYFGLSNLLNNIKISEDNPLLYGTQKNLALLQKAHRLGWENEASDQDAAISPVMDSYCYDNNNYINELDSYSRDRSVSEPACKQLPPPSMRLSKDLRDHIISGAYQQQFNNRLSGKYPQQGMPLNPSLSMSAPQSMSMLPVGAQNGPTSRTQPGIQVCVFCRNNKESESVYTSHVLKDSEGRTVCPILRAYTCPICKANGDSSHTIKYCPENQNARMMQLAGQHQPFGQGNGFRNHQPPRSFRPPFPNPMQLNANLAQHAGGKVRP